MGYTNLKVANIVLSLLFPLLCYACIGMFEWIFLTRCFL